MQATVTLATTSFAAMVARGDTVIQLASLAGITRGVALFANRELMLVDYVTGIGNGVAVRRGQDGTVGTSHNTDQTVFIGRPDQFFDSDPTGAGSTAASVSPHINVQTGMLWMVQGDDTGPMATAREWVPITTTEYIGALGVRTDALTIPT